MSHSYRTENRMEVIGVGGGEMDGREIGPKVVLVLT
jgi:hypothetical protein